MAHKKEKIKQLQQGFLGSNQLLTDKNWQADC